VSVRVEYASDYPTCLLHIRMNSTHLWCCQVKESLPDHHVHGYCKKRKERLTIKIIGSHESRHLNAHEAQSSATALQLLSAILTRQNILTTESGKSSQSEEKCGLI